MEIVLDTNKQVIQRWVLFSLGRNSFFGKPLVCFPLIITITVMCSLFLALHSSFMCSLFLALHSSFMCSLFLALHSSLQGKICLFESRSGRGAQHYVIKLVSDLQQVGVFLWVLRFFSTNKTDSYDITEKVLKVVLNTIKPNQTYSNPVRFNLVFLWQIQIECQPINCMQCTRFLS